MKWPFSRRESLDDAEMRFLQAIRTSLSPDLGARIDPWLEQKGRVRRSAEESVMRTEGFMTHSKGPDLYQVAGVRYSVDSRVGCAELCVDGGNLSGITFGPLGRELFARAEIIEARQYQLPDLQLLSNDYAWLTSRLSEVRLSATGLQASSACTQETILDLEWRLGDKLPVSLVEYLTHTSRFRTDSICFDGGLLPRYVFPWNNDCFIVADYGNLLRYVFLQRELTDVSFGVFDQSDQEVIFTTPSFESALEVLVPQEDE